MAEIVGSAVASEAVSRISSFLSGGKTSHESAEDRAERLEMAVLKIHSIVAVSEDRHVSHLPLLRWKAKLKRVAEEGDDLLRLHKKQVLERSRVISSDGRASGKSVSQILIRAAKRFVPLCSEEEDELLDDSTLRRFERLADGADSFFRLVESGGHPKKLMFLPSLTRSLLSGESVEFLVERGSGSDLVMLWPWPDRGAEDGLEACLSVSHEDEVTLHRNLKMCILFRLSEASNILAIAMSCLELLPPQFDAAIRAIRGVLAETVGQRSHHSNLSEISKWCCQQIQSYHQNDCESSTGDNKRRGTGMLLPHPVVRFTAVCYASASTNGRPCSRVKDGLPLPLELACHVSPYLLPEKHSSQLELVEQDAIRKLLPVVTDGIYDDRRQAWDCKRQIWCPQSTMYCSVGPVASQPLTRSQAYLMESSGAHGMRRKRRRMATTKSQSFSESRNIANS